METGKLRAGIDLHIVLLRNVRKNVQDAGMVAS